MTSTAAPGELERLAETFVVRRGLLRRLLVARLATLRQIMHRSATLAFGRETGLNDFDWLVLSFIGTNFDPAVSTICGRLRRDKGQVSRSVTRLTGDGLVRREQLRAPLRLTERGAEVNRQIDRILKERNRTLLDGLSVEHRILLNDILDKLFRAANTLLAYERRLTKGAAAARVTEIERPALVFDKWRSSSAENDPRSPDWLVMPDLDMLLRLMRQSAGLAHGRVTGLAHFDWLTITHVEVSGPMTLSDLIAALDRNKSQVGRAVARLVAQGLVERRKEPGVASVVLSTTPSGKAAYELILREAERRDAALTEGLTPAEQRGFSAILDHLTHNALGLLASEREQSRADARRKQATALDAQPSLATSST
jgi:DNA-binding MarR family transcriptional regulator